MERKTKWCNDTREGDKASYIDKEETNRQLSKWLTEKTHVLVWGKNKRKLTRTWACLWQCDLHLHVEVMCERDERDERARNEMKWNEEERVYVTVQSSEGKEECRLIYRKYTKTLTLNDCWWQKDAHKDENDAWVEEGGSCLCEIGSCETLCVDSPSANII